MTPVENIQRFQALRALAASIESAAAMKIGATAVGSVCVAVLLAIGSWVRPGAALFAATLTFAGLALKGHAARRVAALDDDDLIRLAKVQRGVGRQMCWFGSGLAVAAWALSPMLIVVVGAFGSLALMLQGVVSAARSANEEAVKDHQPEIAEEECRCLGRVAAVVVTFPLASLAARTEEFAGYEVRAGQIGLMQFLTLCAVAAISLSYATMAVALETKEAVVHSGGGQGESPKGSDDGSQARQVGHGAPTYAEDCPELTDPLAIGHGLGELFKRDGAVKAGCGTQARLVVATSTWISAGICEGNLHSLAISGPEGNPGIVYGEAATFAWKEARQGALVGVETAGPGGGDVDLIRTHAGVYGFVRDHEERVGGNEDAQKCDEVGGEPEPFTRLAPPLVVFWEELVEAETEWLWPERDKSVSARSVAFVGLSSGETLATGACSTDETCVVELGGEAEPVNGSGFAELQGFKTFMPAEEGV